MATKCPECGTEVVQELDYCFGCFRHLATRPTEKAGSNEPKRSRRRGRRASTETAGDATEPGFIPDDELVEATPKQSFITWEPGQIPKGTLTFGPAIQDSEWRRTRRDDQL